MKTTYLKFFRIFLMFACCLPTGTLIAQTSQEAQAGNLSLDKPDFPFFYIWRRVYQKKGVESEYSLFLVNADGSLTPKKSNLTYDDWMDAKNETIEKRDQIYCPPEIMVFDLPDKFISHSQKWKVKEPSDSEWGTFTMHLFNFGGPNQEFEIPKNPERDAIVGDPMGWSPMGWNARLDLFYFNLTTGPSDSRQAVYWQLDPTTKTFTFIGSGANPYFQMSADGNWIVWTDGFAGDWRVCQIHVYDVQKNKDYTLTSNRADNIFYQWVDPANAWDMDPKDQLTNAITTEVPTQPATVYIQLGKDKYHHNQFKEAISQYQLAVKTDPKNAEAYGLLGYAFYRCKHFDQAIKALEASLQINGRELMSIYNQSLAYWAVGDKPRCIQNLSRLYQFAPEYKALVEKDVQFESIIESPEYQEMINSKFMKQIFTK